MQSFQILLNDRYSASTQSGSSELTLTDGYYAYVNKNGGGLVNPSNVKWFLNEEKNKRVANDFFTFLTGNTTSAQALNIISSNQKLSNVFNDYYQKYVVSGNQIANTTVIQQNLTGSNQTIAYTYNHPWYGYAPSKQMTGITKDIYGSINSVQQKSFLNEFTTDESYYVPVYIQRSNNQLSRYKYDLCNTVISSKTASLYPEFSAYTQSLIDIENADAQNLAIWIIIWSIASAFSVAFGGAPIPTPQFTGATNPTYSDALINCFVNLNLETNENAGLPGPLNTVSFQAQSYSVTEGNSLQVRLDLGKPSEFGTEEATVNLSTTNAILGTDFTADKTYPFTFAWAEGEQYKFMNFFAATDFLIENNESFKLDIVNPINLNTGAAPTTTINLKDSTVLRTASLSVAPSIFALASAAPPVASQVGANQIVNIKEGDIFDITVNLDGPAFGVESVKLSFVNSALTPTGTVGPVAKQALPGVEFNVSNTQVTFNFAPGETQKTYTFQAFTDLIVSDNTGAIFELSNPVNALINNNKKVMTVNITDTTGGYKYVHLNFGDIYSEFGNSISNTLMRQLNPQPGLGGAYSNIYISNYNYYLIKYGSTVNFKDYNGSYSISKTFDSITFNNNLVKLNITNIGVVQSMINGQPVNVGQTITINVPSNDYIITASTNANKNATTTLFDFANYKIDIVNNYSGTSQFISGGMNYKLRNTANAQAALNTLTLGNFSLSGLTTSPTSSTNQYRLKSKYKNVNTGRPNSTTCPPVSSFSNSISYSQFYAIDIKKVSVLGIILLNYNPAALYSTPNLSTYDTFEFVPGITNTSAFYTCNGSNSVYNSLNYISLPFKVEP